MKAWLNAAVVCLALPLGACSAITGFDDYAFEKGDDTHDGGSAGSSAGTGAPDSGADGGMAGNGGQSGDGGGAGTSGKAGTGAEDSGVDAGMDAAVPDSGVDAGPECTKAADCGDLLALDCVNEKCVARRAVSGVWLSGGGGIVTTPTTKIRVSIGAPLPMGRATSATFKVTVGAGAGRP